MRKYPFIDLSVDQREGLTQLQLKGVIMKCTVYLSSSWKHITFSYYTAALEHNRCKLTKQTTSHINSRKNEALSTVIYYLFLQWNGKTPLFLALRYQHIP